MVRCEDDDAPYSKRFGFNVQDQCSGRIAAAQDADIRGGRLRLQ